MPQGKAIACHLRTATENITIPRNVRSGLFKMEGKATCHGIVLLIAVIVSGLCCTQGKTLVLLDNVSIKETHSIFFEKLKGEWFFRKAHR